MTNRIFLNRTDSILLDELVVSRLLTSANSGGGKSWLLRRILEQSHGLIQHIVIDMEGEFATLREKFDYILVSKDGDIPAQARTAKHLAHRLLELNVSAIIDVYEMPPHERKRYVRLFIEALVDAPKRLYHPALVVVDEAHALCPEKEQAESAGAIKDLASRGRKRGFCLILATQRLAKLSKDAAAEMNNVLIGRTGLDIDQKRAAEMLGFTTREERIGLRDLDPGEFLAFGPAISKAVKPVKVGPVKTTHPKAGGRIIKTTPEPTKKIREILSSLKDIPEQVTKKIESETELKQELSNVRRELTLVKQKAGQIEVREVGIPEKEVEACIKKELRARDMEWERALTDYNKQMKEVSFDKPRQPEIKIETKALPTRRPLRKPLEIESSLQKKMTHHALPVQGDCEDVDLGKAGPHRMLSVLVSLYPRRFTRAQLGMLSKVKHTGGTFRNNLTLLRRGGYVDENGEYLTASERGLAYFGEERPTPMTTDEVIEMWRQKLGGGTRRIFEVLLEMYPEYISREELAERASMKSSGGSYRNCLSTLRTNVLIDEEAGMVKLSDNFMVEEIHEF